MTHDREVRPDFAWSGGPGSEALWRACRRQASTAELLHTPSSLFPQPSSPAYFPAFSLPSSKLSTAFPFVEDMAYKKYSCDVKLLVVRWAGRGIKLPDIAKRLGFNVSSRSVLRWKKLYQKTRRVVKEPALYEKRGVPGLLTAEEVEFVKEVITEDPTLYIDEAQKMLYRHTGKFLSETTVLRTLHHQLNLTLKTGRTVHPQQSDASRGRFLLKMADFPPECFVFVDESGVSVDEVRRGQAWAPKGKRTARLVRRSRGMRYNLIHGIGLSGAIGTLVKTGTIRRVHFLWYLKKRLLPFMNRFPAVNSILILDNARIHKGGEVQKLCSSFGVLLIFLPAYSPDLNPTEKGFSAFKAHLRRHQNLDCVDVINAIYGVTEEVFTSALCVKLFEGSGYV